MDKSSHTPPHAKQNEEGCVTPVNRKVALTRETWRQVTRESEKEERLQPRRQRTITDFDTDSLEDKVTVESPPEPLHDESPES